MPLTHGRTSTDKVIPLLLDASGRPILAALGTDGNYYPVKVDPSGRIIPVGLDAGGTYRPITVDTSGRAIISALDTAAAYRPVLVDPSGRVVLAGTDWANVTKPIRTDYNGCPVIAGLGTDWNFHIMTTDPNGRVIVSALDTGGAYQPLKVDTGGQPHVDLFGWQSGAWRKQPLELGYSSWVYQRIVNLNAAAGANTIATPAVPANTLWVITAVEAVDNQTNPTRISLIINTGVTGCTIRDGAGVGIARSVTWTGDAVMPSGWYIQAYFEGCTLNDDLYLNAIGRTIDII